MSSIQNFTLLKISLISSSIILVIAIQHGQVFLIQKVLHKQLQSNYCKRCLQTKVQIITGIATNDSSG